jgi:flagellar biosynthesis/type III secretory pathway protein FliH
MQLISGFVDSYLRLNSNEEALFQSELGIMETREQEQIMQITNSWKEQGIVEGREQGIVEGQSSTILRLLNRKLGNLPESIADYIKSLKPIQLDSLTEDLLEFQSLGDLQNWLSNS